MSPRILAQEPGLIHCLANASVPGVNSKLFIPEKVTVSLVLLAELKSFLLLCFRESSRRRVSVDAPVTATSPEVSISGFVKAVR